MFYVYVLKSKKTNFLYIGYTSNLKQRFQSHNSGSNPKEFTHKHRPWFLVYYEAFFNEQDARNREAALKNHGAGIGQIKKRIQRSLESAE